MSEIDVIFTTEEQKEVTLEFKGIKIPIVIRKLGWSEKNKILAKCFTYQQDGTISFEFDRYTREMLKRCVVKAPWGETNEIFLSRIDADFGAMLEKLVPRAFEEGKNTNFFDKEQSTS